jgi:hypothetical protein
VKAVTIQQPWAYCVARGAKPIENRFWSTSYRGQVAIHAGLGWSASGAADERVLRLLARHMNAEQRARHLLLAGELGARLVFGAVLAVAELVDCHRADGCCQPWGDPWLDDERPVWHWVLRGARKLERPALAVGRQGLWDVPLEPLETLLRVAEVIEAGPFALHGEALHRTVADALAASFRREAYLAAPSTATVRLAQLLLRNSAISEGRVAAG